MTKFTIAILSLFLSQALWATQQPMDEVVVRNSARKHLYPGGADEEPLKVQASLPILKIKSAVEDEEPPMPDDSTD